MSEAKQPPAPDEQSTPPEGEVQPLLGGGSEMTFLDHLEELRFVILRCLLAFIVGIMLVAVFIHPVNRLVMHPLNSAFLRFDVPPEQLVTTSMVDAFTAIIQLAFLGGFTVAFPFGLYFLGRFVAPALTEKEARLLIPMSMTCMMLFLAGAALAYFLVLPAAISVSIKLNMFFGWEIIWRVANYYSMVFWLILLLGLAFQFPLVIVALTYLGVLSAQSLRQGRRIAVVAILIASALITPGGDPITLFVLAGPLYALYEGSILASALIERKQREA
ncbi:MAG: twin-arginine translocase subunit TatC [Verrucomicrobiota bacterium]